MLTKTTEVPIKNKTGRKTEMDITFGYLPDKNWNLCFSQSSEVLLFHFPDEQRSSSERLPRPPVQK